MRELMNDVHSISLLVYSTVAGHKFSVALHDNGSTRSLVKLCTIPNAGVWTLIPLPNIPVWDSGGAWSINPGAMGYSLTVVLACGSTYIAPAADTWQAGNFLGAPGMTNFGAAPLNSAFYFGFVQHEPGPVCTTLIDCPFTRNYDECLRYYYKTYDYETAVGSATPTGMKSFVAPVATTTAYGPVQLPKPMAKLPAITFYNYATGAANSVRDGFNTDHASAAANAPSKNGFNYVSFTTATTGAVQVYAHYTADTGW
jgi:hypothetical protein